MKKNKKIVFICILAIILFGLMMYRGSAMHTGRRIEKNRKELTKFLKENIDILSRLEREIYPLGNEVRAFISYNKGEMDIVKGERELTMEQKELLEEVLEWFDDMKVDLYWVEGKKVLKISFPDIVITPKYIYTPFVYYCEDETDGIFRETGEEQEILPNWHYDVSFLIQI